MIAVVPSFGAWGIVQGTHGEEYHGVRAWREEDGAEGVLQVCSKRFVVGDARVNPARDHVATEVLTCLYTQRFVEWERSIVYHSAAHVALMLLAEYVQPTPSDVERVMDYVVHQPRMEHSTRSWKERMRIPYECEVPSPLLR